MGDQFDQTFFRNLPDNAESALRDKIDELSNVNIQGETYNVMGDERIVLLNGHVFSAFHEYNVYSGSQIYLNLNDTTAAHRSDRLPEITTYAERALPIISSFTQLQMLRKNMLQYLPKDSSLLKLMPSSLTPNIIFTLSEDQALGRDFYSDAIFKILRNKNVSDLNAAVGRVGGHSIIPIQSNSNSVLQQIAHYAAGIFRQLKVDIVEKANLAETLEIIQRQ